MAIQEKSTYQPLNEHTVVHFVKENRLFSEDTNLSVEEIGDGNLNLVFLVSNPAASQSYIVKQALPYAKVVGESWPLTLDRSRIESEALIQAAETVPHLVPSVFLTDSSLAVTVMEDLSSHTILRQGLIKGNVYPRLAEDIGTFTARTAFYSSDFYLHPFEKKELVSRFTNPELCKITEDLVFTDPFFDYETNDFSEDLRPAAEALWNHSDVKKEAALLKYKFLTEAEVLLHGDLHTGSIFVTEDSTKIIDPEFAFYGPLGFDLGQFFANLVLNHLAQVHHLQEPFNRETYQFYLLETIEKTWKVFYQTFTQLLQTEGTEPFIKLEGVAEAFLSKTLDDAIGFAGCEIIRRTIGLAHVADLDSISCPDVQLFLKKKALELGAKLLTKRHSLSTIQQFIQLIRGA